MSTTTKTAKAKARARASDPATSHAAARSIEETQLCASRRMILGLLRRFGDGTDEDIARWYRRTDGRISPGNVRVKLSPSGLRTRRCELVRAGFVRDSGARVKLRSGRLAIVWQAV